MGDSALRFKGIVRQHRLAGGLVASGVVAAIAIVLVPDLGPDLAPVFVMLNAAVAGTLYLRKARGFDGRERQAWTLIGSGFVVAAVGVLGLGSYQAVTGEAPAFGPADLLFISTYVIITIGLVRLPHVTGDLTQRLRLIVDGFVGAISMAAVVWVWFLDDVWSELRGADAWERWVGSLYPLVDFVFLIVLLTIFLRRSAHRFDRRLLLFGAAFLLQAGADLTYVVNGAGRTFADVEPLWPLFVLAGAGFVAVGMIVEHRPPLREYAERDLSWLPTIAPYALAAVMVGMLLVQVQGSAISIENLGLFYSTLVVAALVVARQGIAIRENHIHVERERRALISSISHELRTPLTAMVGFLDVLTDERFELPPDEQRDLLGVVDQQARYMGRIVSDMVALARGRSDRMELSESTAPVREILVKAAGVADGGVDGLTIECDEHLGAMADPDRVQQAVVNLLSNATRYGGAQRLVRARTVGPHLRIEVHDDGPGVPKRHQLTIWERFERGAHRLDANVPGSGIGLAIVEAIAAAHGGRAVYETSPVLGGVCFILELPNRAVRLEVPEPIGAELD